MRLHLAIRSDWSDVAPQQRTNWQHIAAGSRGVITPGNIISVAGAILVIWGLYLLAHGHLNNGLIAVLIGRFADVLDGLVAELTKTKSPLGEGIDATIDKILILLALIVLLENQLVPLLVGVVMGLHALYIVGVSYVAKLQKTFIHPSRAGKLGAAFEWICVGFYLLAAALKLHQHGTTIAYTAAIISFCLFVVTGFWSSLNYTRYVYYKKAMQK